MWKIKYAILHLRSKKKNEYMTKLDFRQLINVVL